MKRFVLAFTLVALQGAVPAFADDCPNGNCEPRTRETCFNIQCTFENPNAPAGYQRCEVSAVFDKKVTLGGGEVRDDSSQRDNPEFQVTCDGSSVFNNSARRFTDLLGTRIQGETGPHPSLSLPRGALHTGAHGGAGSHYSPAALELNVLGQWIRTGGTCFIWSGAP